VWRRDHDPREAYDGGPPIRRLSCRAWEADDPASDLSSPFLFALQIPGQSRTSTLPAGIVAASPNTIVGDVLVGIRRDCNNLVLKFRCELRHRSVNICRRRGGGPARARQTAAEHDIHIEQAFAIQRLRDLVAWPVPSSSSLFRERDALFRPMTRKPYVGSDAGVKLRATTSCPA
jgi:hypothetical protein